MNVVSTERLIAPHGGALVDRLGERPDGLESLEAVTLTPREVSDLDMIAVMGSQPRLWSIYGKAWGWPPPDMSAEADRLDLARHAAEMETHESFNYALFDADETALLGCVYIDPPEKPGADAEISWWVVDECVGTDLETALDEFVPRWIAEVWPLDAPRYVGRDLTWDDWLALPDLR